MPPNYEKSIYVFFVAEKQYCSVGRKENVNIVFTFEDVLGNTYKQEAHIYAALVENYLHVMTTLDMRSPERVSKSE